jgi:serine/threonine protein kinase
MDREIVALVQRMTKKNPNERPTIDELLEEEFFEDGGRCAREKVAEKEKEKEKELVESEAEREMEVEIW